VIRLPLAVLTASLVLLVALGMLPALRAYRVSKAENGLMRDKALQVDRIRGWLCRHPEERDAEGPSLKEGAEGPLSLEDEAALIAFLQETSLRFGADLESVKPVFSSRGVGAKTRAGRLLAYLRVDEQGMRAFLNSLEETPMPWRIEEVQISGDKNREAGVAVHLSLEKLGRAGVSLEEIERYLSEEGPVMGTSQGASDPRRTLSASDPRRTLSASDPRRTLSASDPARTFFRPPAGRPSAPQEKNALAVLSDGWRLVGILQGADSRAVIEDRSGQRVFTVRPGDAVAGATVGPIGADGVLLMMGNDTFRLTFE